MEVQSGGYPKGAKESRNKKGYRLYRVNFLNVDGSQDPLYIDDDEDKGVKIFRGKRLPGDVAKKVVTEICRLLKKKQPTYYKKWCKGVTEDQLKQRTEDIIKNRQTPEKIDLSLYPGFRFELVDTLNTTIDGENRTYVYYGEQHRLTNPKRLKGSKLYNESNIIPIRKNMTLEQALVDHHFKSNQAKQNYKKTGNLKSSSSSASTSKSGGSPRQRIKNQLKKMSTKELHRNCQNNWKVQDLNEMLRSLNLSQSGLKKDKCERLQLWHKSVTR